MPSVYLAGNVDNNSDGLSYYDLISDMVDKDQNVVLFMPGRAFVPIGDVTPDYIVDVNRVALENAKIVVFYINGTPTTGTWLEASWCVDNKHKLKENWLGASQPTILFAEPTVKISVYMKWIAKQLDTVWITDRNVLCRILNDKIRQTNAEKFIEVTEEFTLGDSLNIREGGDFNE